MDAADSVEAAEATEETNADEDVAREAVSAVSDVVGETMPVPVKVDAGLKLVSIVVGVVAKDVSTIDVELSLDVIVAGEDVMGDVELSSGTVVAEDVATRDVELSSSVVASVSELTAADMLLPIDCSVAVMFSADWTCRLINRGK